MLQQPAQPIQAYPTVPNASADGVRQSAVNRQSQARTVPDWASVATSSPVASSSMRTNRFAPLHTTADDEHSSDAMPFTKYQSRRASKRSHRGSSQLRGCE